MPTSAAQRAEVDGYVPAEETPQRRTVPRASTVAPVVTPRRSSVVARTPQQPPLADMRRKYDLEASLLLVGWAFLAILWRSPDFGTLAGIQNLLDLFKIQTSYYALDGAVSLTFLLMFVAWLVNEFALRWVAVTGHRTGSAPRFERTLVPLIALGWLGMPWLAAFLTDHLGLYFVLLVLLSIQLGLQLLPYLRERRGMTSRASVSRYAASILILPFIALALMGGPGAQAQTVNFKPDVTAAVVAPASPATVPNAPALVAQQPVQPPFEDIRAKVSNANRHVGTLGDVRWLVVHHSGTSGGDGLQFTLGHNDWSNTPYHFVILPDGTIQWLQDLTIPSYNAGFVSNDPATEYGDIINNHSIAVCLVGNFDVTQPTAAQMKSLETLLRWLMARYNVPADHIIGHREAEGAHTRCPGNLDLDGLRARMSRLATTMAGSLSEAEQNFARSQNIPDEYLQAALQAQAKYGVSAWVLLGLAAQESGFGRNTQISAAVAYDEVGKNPRINAPAQRAALETLAKTLNMPVAEIRGTPGEGSLGPFQFQPATWLRYAPPGGDPRKVADATDAAARLLSENGWRNDDPAAQHAALQRWNTHPEHNEKVLNFAAQYAQAAKGIL